jgi:hypothetical protein
MKTGIQACEKKMKERKLESGVGKGKRKGKGEGVASFGATPHGRVAC